MLSTAPEQTDNVWNHDRRSANEVVAQGAMGNLVDSLIVIRKKRKNGGNQSRKGTQNDCLSQLKQHLFLGKRTGVRIRWESRICKEENACSSDPGGSTECP